MGLRRCAARRSNSTLAAATLAIAAAAVLTVGDTAGAQRLSGALRPPPRLADTRLYSNFASRTVDPRNIPYSPQYPLWSDGAGKRRWIYLPPGSRIDASDPEVWRFPVGTKFWKEFSWSRRVETRYLERTREGWMYAAYAWREDESDAVLAPEGGVLTTQEVAPGRRHVIPSVADCKSCHRGGRAEILGFGALQLSQDRDPLAPNREPLGPGMPTLPTLVERRLVRGLPRELLAHPPRIVTSTPAGRAAMGYLHANCGICHDSVGPMASLGLDLRHALGARDPGDQPAAAAIGHSSKFQLPGVPRGKSVWVDPGSPSSSTVLMRMASRNPVVQMPPLGTQVVDQEAVRVVREWIEQDLPRKGGE